MTGDERGRAILQRHDQLLQLRQQHHGEWETISTLLMRNRKAFAGGGQPGAWSHRGVFNSVPVIAANNLAAGLYGTATNPANRWLTIETPDEDLNAWHAAKSWLDIVTRRVLASFRPATSNFYDSVMPFYGDVVAFGTAVQVDEMQEENRRILDRTLPLSEAVIEIDDDGTLTTLMRKFRLSLREAARSYPDTLPQTLLDKAADGKTGDVTFVWSLAVNDGYAPGGERDDGKPFASVVVCEEQATIVAERGLDDMPGYATRWDVDARETWGRGVGYFTLPDTRTLNLATEANIRAAQWHSDPAMLAPSKRQLREDFRLHPGATLYGAMTMGGRDLVRFMDGPRGLPFGIELVNNLEQKVQEAFGFSLLTVTNRSGMTTTEFLERQADRLRLMAPFLGRIQSEFLTRKVERRFRMLWRAGQLPPPPAELSDQALDVRYVSAAAMAQRSTEGAAVAQLVQNLSPLMAVDPRYARRLDPDGVAETLAEAFGAPARALRSREDADAIAQAEAQAAQMQQMMENAPGMARAARDVAEAGAG